MQTISVHELAKKQSIGPIRLIDVRTPVEFREVHAIGAQNVPLDSPPFKTMVENHRESSDDVLYVICKSGGRSSKACQQFIDAGADSVVSVDGGTSAWDAAGLPVLRGKKAISLERQVRITAGSLAFAGSLAAIVTSNALWAGVPAFIGAGLTFAGVTDTCGMGMLLAKMPWNQCSDGAACATEATV
ncbi:rhodanese-like domain-containing protein [Rubripirellula amarantea]|nr:rhodanese-like domain-containing protein [Rubripirellula amarantea]